MAGTTGAAAPSASMEWRNFWPLPLVAALGYATSVIHIYSLGVYVEPIGTQFGWDRTTTTFGLTIATLIQALLSVPIGMLVDRIGPRPLAIIGIALTCAAFALLGTATGSVLNWYALWTVLALATLPVQATVWTAAVATRFARSRGLAFALTLCGASVAAALFPYLATRLIAAYGWQTAIALQALIWGAIAWPPILLLFRGARDKGARQDEAAPDAEHGITFFEGLRSSIYLRLLLASLLFTFTILAMVVHFVPILTDGGLERAEAAGLAALIGLFSIVGRLSTGLLLDRFSAALIGAIIFMLPVGSALLLLSADPLAASAAAVLIGLTLGAEVDVIVYLTTRHFGLKSFGALYGGMLVALSVGAGIGPLAASAVFDRSGSYDAFLWATVAMMVGASLSLLTLPRPGFGPAKG